MPDGVADHGKDAGVLIATKNLTTYLKTHTWEVTPDVHDTSGSGMDDKTYRGGQVTRTLTIGGWTDDDTTDGPRMLEGMAGDTVACERRPSGIGSGKRKQTFSAVVGKYNETGKNDDIFQWTCDLQVTGTVTEGTQT